MNSRKRHQNEVLSFIQEHFSVGSWELTLPHGWGNETYFAKKGELTLFIKLGVQTARYQTLSSLGLTAKVLADGFLDDGTSILVQQYIVGRNPSRSDFPHHLRQFATTIDLLHHNQEIQKILPIVSSTQYRDVGLEALFDLRQKWNLYKSQVPSEVGFIENSLDYLENQMQGFTGEGLVASHNDICNANWLITPDNHLYLLDLESMSLDDPALDIGAILWWYFPPEFRPEFLEITGYSNDLEFKKRMQVRMTMHCLYIFLPRKSSFDQFNPTSFSANLEDFRASIAGQDNPKGYIY